MSEWKTGDNSALGLLVSNRREDVENTPAMGGQSPINLADYTPAMKAFIRARELACVYVLALADGTLVRIGHATDIHNHLSMMLSVSSYEIQVHHLLWTPVRLVAVAIDNGAREQLKGKHMRQKWFSCAIEEAIGTVTAIRDRFFAQANIVPHERFICQMHLFSS